MNILFPRISRLPLVFKHQKPLMGIRDPRLPGGFSATLPDAIRIMESIV